MDSLQKLLNTPRLIFAFEGQGGVNPNMGKHEFETIDTYRKCFENVSAIIDEDVADICWGSRKFKLKSNPYYAHVALFTTGYALFYCLTQQGIFPKYIIGHSLGEINGIIMAGALTIEDGARLIKKRGELFERNAKSTRCDMVALIGKDHENILHCIHSIRKECEIYIANLNSPKQIIIACKNEDYGSIAAQSLKNNIRTVKLDLGNGCHSPFVAGIEAELNSIIDVFTILPPKYPIYSTSFNRDLKTPSEIKESLKRHLLAPVDWNTSLNRLTNVGYTAFVQIGYSKVLKGLILDNHRYANIFLAADLLKESVA